MSLLTPQLKLKCFAAPFWTALHTLESAKGTLYYRQQWRKSLGFQKTPRFLALAQFNYWCSQVDKSEWTHSLETRVTITGHRKDSPLLKETCCFCIPDDFALQEWMWETVHYDLRTEINQQVTELTVQRKTQGLKPMNLWENHSQQKELEEMLETLETNKDQIILF